MKTILISDTWGARIPRAFRNLLPDVYMDGAQTNNAPYHPHGGYCGWLAGIPLQAHRMQSGEEVALFFVQTFNHKGRLIPGAEKALLDMIRLIEPVVVSRSWGSWDGDDDLAGWSSREYWREWSTEYKALCRELNIIDFAAAGNNDRNDRDDDIDAPQSLMRDHSMIVGSHNRKGIPSKWSGDGTGGACTMWGEKIYSPNEQAEWDVWSGTSATAPKAAGVCAVSCHTRDEFLELVKLEGKRPKTAGLWHPKTFHGSLEHLWQDHAFYCWRNGIPMPPVENNATAKVLYHDMRPVHD